MKKYVHILFIAFLANTIAFGQNNNSLNYDGTDDAANFPTCAGLVGNEFTIEGWIRCDVQNDPQVVLMAFNPSLSSPNANVTLEVRPTGVLRFNSRPNAGIAGGDEIFSQSVVANGQWHHFAAVKRTDLIMLYIDGFMESVKCGLFGVITAVPEFDFGRNKFDASANFRQFKGNMDDLKIWSVARTAREIHGNYQRESAGGESGLFSNYKFDVKSDTIFDCSPNKRHGLRIGSGGTNNKPQFVAAVPALVDVPCDYNFVSGANELKTNDFSKIAAISPNPAGDFLKIELMAETRAQGQVSTLDGRLLRSFDIDNPNFNLDISGLAPGAYLLRLNTSKFVSAEQFFKM